MRPREEIEVVAGLIAEGRNDCEIARTTGIPRRTVHGWRTSQRRADRRFDGDPDPSLLPAAEYAYLLGMYLGDGCISEYRRDVRRLRVVLDAAYPGIVAECRDAIVAVGPPNRVSVQRRRDSRCVEVSMYWKHWPWLLPQHGPGPKHRRVIRLRDWQSDVLSGQERLFLRGLIHSDGCRYVAHERKGSRHRSSVRYSFCNRSEDIKDLFCAACDTLGIPWTRTVKQVSVYRKAAVAELDTFIGPKH